MKTLAILGSTGSIGRSALAVVDAHPSRLRVAGLAAGDNGALLAEQVRRYRPRIAAMASAGALDRVRGDCDGAASSSSRTITSSSTCGGGAWTARRFAGGTSKVARRRACDR